MKVSPLTIVVGGLLLQHVIPASSRYYDHRRRRRHKCEFIQEEMCAGTGMGGGFRYNTTMMPNILGHDTQNEASARFNEFIPLINSQCSTKIIFFLCSLHFPMCTTQVDVAIPACRPMCEEVRSKCEPFMKSFDFEWPTSIDCSKLPLESDEDRLCMQPPAVNEDYEDYEKEIDEELQPPSISRDPTHRQEFEYPHSNDDEYKSNVYDVTNTDIDTWMEDSNPINDEFDYETVYLGRDDEDLGEDEDLVGDVGGDKDLGGDEDLPGHDTNTPHKTKNVKKIPQKFILVERSGTYVPSCEEGTDVLFSSYHKRLAYIVQLVFALLCFISTSITICTFAIDSKRFRYPERPIVFLAICYNLYSVAYIFRSVSGESSSISCIYDEELKVHHLVKGGFESTSCTAVFFILYYFGMTASAWWVVLSFTWFLSACFKWGHEAIAGYAFYFHLSAWSLPAAQTILVLITTKIDGDELTGMCYVGNLDADSLMYFVIIPLTFYSLVGAVALVFGFTYLFKIHRVIKHRGGKAAGNFEKLMLKIGVFSVFYMVPAACIIAVNFYQYQNFSHWSNRAQNTQCIERNHHSSSIPRYTDSYQSETYPDYTSWMDESGISQSFVPWNNLQERNHYDNRPNYEDVTGSKYDYDVEFVNQGQKSSLRHPEGLNEVAESSPSSQNSFQLSSDGSEERYDCTLQDSIPPLPIFVIKIVMSLIAGITSGMWIWCRKTVQSWTAVCSSLRWCRCCESNDSLPESADTSERIATVMPLLDNNQCIVPQRKCCIPRNIAGSACDDPHAHAIKYTSQDCLNTNYIKQVDLSGYYLVQKPQSSKDDHCCFQHSPMRHEVDDCVIGSKPRQICLKSTNHHYCGDLQIVSSNQSNCSRESNMCKMEKSNNVGPQHLSQNFIMEADHYETIHPSDQPQTRYFRCEKTKKSDLKEMRSCKS